jgi:hypothetical protein
MALLKSKNLLAVKPRKNANAVAPARKAISLRGNKAHSR